MDIMVRYKVLAICVMICLLLSCLIAACISTQQGKENTSIHAATPVPVVTKAASQITDSSGNNTSGDNSSRAGISTNPIGNLTTITGNGTVIYHDLEGGFYSITGDDGRQYLPLSFPPDLKINGTKVKYSFRPARGTASIFMSGEPVEIISIEPVKNSFVPNMSKPLVEFEKAGGVADSYEILRIYKDQRGEVTKWNQVQQVNLSQDETNNLTILFNKTDFSSLKPQYMPANPAPDAMTYTIRYLNKTIKMTEGEMPDQLKPVTGLLNDILAKHTISPITANKTLEGTAWRLSSYLRSDGISMIVQNSTQISAIFGKDGMVTGSSGCNTYSGLFNQTGGNISFNHVVVTRMACLNQGTMEIETAYLKLLENVRMITGQERKLTMSDINNTTLLVYNQMNT